MLSDLHSPSYVVFTTTLWGKIQLILLLTGQETERLSNLLRVTQQVQWQSQEALSVQLQSKSFSPISFHFLSNTFYMQLSSLETEFTPQPSHPVHVQTSPLLDSSLVEGPAVASPHRAVSTCLFWWSLQPWTDLGGASWGRTGSTIGRWLGWEVRGHTSHQGLHPRALLPSSARQSGPIANGAFLFLLQAWTLCSYRIWPRWRPLQLQPRPQPPPPTQTLCLPRAAPWEPSPALVRGHEKGYPGLHTPGATCRVGVPRQPGNLPGHRG